MGWHAGTGSIDNLDDVKTLVDNYSTHKMPLEALWFDGEYMDRFASFSVDRENFAGLREYAEALQAQGKRVVLKLHAGLSNDDNKLDKYVTLAGDAFIKIAPNYTGNASERFEAQTFSNRTIFLDWFHEDAKSSWSQGLFDLW